MVLPFLFISCSISIADGIREEMKTQKSQCPQDMGEGITMTDANFYENEKILEFVASIEGIEPVDIDDDVIDAMKAGIVEAFKSDISAFEKFSVKTILNFDYKYRYIYTDIDGNKLCTIEITKHDL
jgi:hypothetical protein